MNVFQLIKQVLDDLYEMIPGTEEEKDEAIRQEIAWLSERYHSIRAPEKFSSYVIDYSSAVTRFAYIYKYTTAHASFIQQLISQSKELTALFNSDARVSCIGGGPGSDLLGILKHLIATDVSSTVTCCLYDRIAVWGESWEDVARNLNASSFRLISTFQTLDVTDETQWKSRAKLFYQSNLITLVYFLSEILNTPNAEPFFEHLFCRVPRGTWMLFLDNNMSSVYGWFDELAARCDWYIVDAREGMIVTTFDEEKTDLSPYYGKFEDPKLKSNVAYRIAGKC